MMKAQGLLHDEFERWARERGADHLGASCVPGTEAILARRGYQPVEVWHMKAL